MRCDLDLFIANAKVTKYICSFSGVPLPIEWPNK